MRVNFPAGTGALLLFTGCTSGQSAILSKSTPARIMPLGDSITRGFYGSVGGYRLPLQQKLKAQGYSVTFVGKEDNGQPQNSTGFAGGMTNPNHEGYGSFQINDIADGGTREGHSAPPIEQTLAADRPDVVLVMLGTNDIFQNIDPPHMPDRMDALLTRIFRARKSVKVIVAMLTPLGDKNADAVAARYNAALPAIIARHRQKRERITVVNMHDALNPATDLADGTHPNQMGFEKMAAVWDRALTGTGEGGK